MKQMQNKNQKLNQLGDKKALLQQQMEISNQISANQQGQKNPNYLGRKNINQMLNNFKIQNVGQAENYQMNNQGPIQSQQQRISYQNPQQQQMQPQQPIESHSIYQSDPYSIQPYPSPTQAFTLLQQQLQFPQQQKILQQTQGGGGGILTSPYQVNEFDKGFSNQQSSQDNQQNVNDNNKISLARGNRNFMKLENADMVEVNKKQQQKSEYQKELEKQIQEKKRQKEIEQEKIKREELLEEERVLREQEMQKKQLEEENNSKKKQQENLQKENQQIRDQKNKSQKNLDFNPSLNNSKLKPNQYEKNVLQINQVSREFLNEEKKNEGLDPRASLMDFERKKSSQHIISQQSQIQTPSNSNQGPQIPMKIMGNQNVGYNQIGVNNMNEGQVGNGMMFGNGMMGYGMMMTPHLIQQQQMLMKQQNEFVPQLYELKLEMQAQQMQMQQKIEQIQSQANLAIQQRNKAESKYQQLNKQIQMKEQQQKNYQLQLQNALTKYHPNNQPHQALSQDLNNFIYPTTLSPSLPQSQKVYPLNQIYLEKQQIQPQQQYVQLQQLKHHKKMETPIQQNEQQERLAEINITQHQLAEYQKQPTQQITTLQNIPSQDNQELDSHLKQKNSDSAQKAMQEYMLKMQQYGMKSLVSDNKFIPLDILDKVKDQQISLSKLGKYGVDPSQINSNSVQNIPQHSSSHNHLNPYACDLGRHPQSKQSSNNFAIMENKQRYDIPSINSDIIKEIDNMMNKNGDQVDTQQSFYQQNKPLILDQDNMKINTLNKNSFSQQCYSSYHPNIDNKLLLEKTSSRLENKEFRKTGFEQNNPFGNAAKGILGDSKAFQFSRPNSQHCSSTNNEYEGLKLGSDFPDFSIKDNKIGINLKKKNSITKLGSGHIKMETNNDKKNINNNYNNNDNNQIPTYTLNNNPTYNTNQFDLEKINKKNEERLDKLNQFFIPTINEFNVEQKDIQKIQDGQDNENYFNKLDQLLIRTKY